MKIKRRAIAFFMAAILAAGGLTGCGSSSDEIINDIMELSDEDGNSNSSIGTLASKLGVSNNYQTSLDTGDSDLTSLSIDLENISVPAVDSMKVVYCQKVVQDSAYKKRMCESIFDTGKAIYVYDEDNQTVDYYEKEITLYREMADEAYLAGADDWAQELEEYAAEAEKNIDTAPEEREAAGDYSASAFLGYIDGNQYVLKFYDVMEDGIGRFSNMGLYYYPLYDAAVWSEYRSIDGSYYTYCNYSDYYSGECGDNQCLLSEDEAIGFCQSFFAGLGIEDISEDNICDLIWEYDDGALETLETETDGYYVHFTRYIDGALVYNGDMTDWTDDFYYMYCSEGYSIEIDSNNIFSINCLNMLSATDEEDAELLSWEDLIGMLDENLSVYLTENPIQYSDLTFNTAELTYIRIKDEAANGEYTYIPAWYFTYTENETVQFGIIVDGRDGTIYGIKDVSDRIF